MTKKKPAPCDQLHFEAKLERFAKGQRAYYVHVPLDVKEVFGTRSSVRMKGTINGIPIERALMPTGNGDHHVLIPIDIRRKAKLRLGDKVTVVLTRIENQQEVLLPEELSAALELEPKIFEAFNKLNPGVRRGMAYWVNSGKKTETRIQRALEILRRFQAGELIFGGRKVKVE